MTAHALERLAERLPEIAPAVALRQIRGQIESGTARLICETICGETVWGVPFPSGDIFAVVAQDGQVKTALTPGMVVTTPTGPLELPRRAPLSPGLHRIPAADYHADKLAPAPSLSSTLARLLLNRSPRHAWWASPRLNPDWQPEDKAVFDVGRAAHRAVLGAGADYAVIPADYRAANGAASTKEAKAFIAEARDMGLTPVKAEVADQVEVMASAVRGRLAAMGIRLAPERSELGAVAQIDGCWCRALFDNVPERGRVVYDIKTTTDASPEAVVAAIRRYGYDVQAAHYLDVMEAATGERRRMRFVFVEKEPPHEVFVGDMHDAPGEDGDWMETARSKAREARRIWRECSEAGEWPGFPARIGSIRAPIWHAQDWADRETGRPVIEKPSADALRAAREFQAPEGVK